ncbi:MAG: hypothetical protein RR528_00075 [Angelakisella sp.]
MRAEHLASTLADRNTMYNVQPYNQSVARNNPVSRPEKNNGRRDTAAISPTQRANSMIEAIRKQKQSIIENKNQLVKTTMEAGKDIDTIQPQLDSYNELLQTLDDQIAGIIRGMAEQQAAELEKAKEKAEVAKEESPKSEEELEAEHLSNIANLSDDMKQTEQISSAKNKVEGEVRVKKSEIELDRLTIDNLKSKRFSTGAKVKDMVASNMRMIANKQSDVSVLEDRTAQLDAAFGKQLNNTVEKLAENNKHHDKPEETDTPNTATRNAEVGEWTTDIETEQQQ